MNIKVLSDLHLEFGDFNPGSGEVLVLAGDICTAVDFAEPKDDELNKRFRNFFKHIGENYDKVFYVMGNHEHYHNSLYHTPLMLKEVIPANCTLLDNSSEYYKGMHFVGATMWSDFCNQTPAMLETCRGRMNDYQLIWDREQNKLQPETVLNEFDNSVTWLNQVLPTLRGPVTVVSHHAPSFKSIEASYRSSDVRGAYASDLTNLIEFNPNIKYWFHGHIHGNNDYTVGNTRVISNPRGYAGKGENPNFNPELSLPC